MYKLVYKCRKTVESELQDTMLHTVILVAYELHYNAPYELSKYRLVEMFTNH